MPKTTYRWVGRIVCIVLGIVVALFVAEILVRHFDPQITLSEAEDFSFPCFAQGASRWIKLASNKTCILRSINGDFPNTVVKTNSLGLRNPEIPLTKPPSTKRILFIGDSYTMGWGVAEQSAYPRLTEKLLDTASLPFAVQDINAGFTASGPSGYYLYLKQHGLDLSPDIIVIGFYLGNDILARRDVEWVKTDADGLPLVLRSKSTYVDAKGEMRKTTLPLEYRIPFLSESNLYILLVNTLLARAPTADQENVSKNFVNALICQYKEACHEMDKEKAEVMSVFKGMKKLADSRNAKLLIVIIPTDFQIHEISWIKYRLPIPLTFSDRSWPDRQFSEWFKEAGIDSVDLLPAFMDHQDQLTYFPLDDHWNTAGHSIAAETLMPILTHMLTSYPP